MKTKEKLYKRWTILSYLALCSDLTLLLSATIHLVQFFVFNISIVYVSTKLVSPVDLT